MTQLAAKFKEAVQSVGRIAIVIAQVDPDALAAALSLKEIIAMLSAHSTHTAIDIVYGGDVANSQNRAIINYFNLQMIPFSKYDFSGKSVALVDSSKIADRRIAFPENTVLSMIIDHHREPDPPAGNNQFYWVDDVGSTSTMIVELYQALGFEIEKISPVLAVMLTLGIRIDTDTLIYGSDRDAAAHALVVKRSDPKDLKRLLHPSLSKDYFDHLQMALQNKCQKGARMVAGIGTVDRTDGDDVALIADMLIRDNTVSLAVVWAIIDDNVRIAARNDDSSEPLNDFLRQRFGQASGSKFTVDGREIGGALLEFKRESWMTKAFAFDESRKKFEEFIGQLINDLVFQD